MQWSCSLPQGRRIQSKQFSLFFLKLFSQTMTHLSSQSTRTGNRVNKWDTSSSGVSFFLRPLQLPLVFQQAGIMQSEGCVSVQTILLILVVHSAAFDKREEQNNLSGRSKNVPGLVQTDILTPKSQTSNLVQNCGLWKMWCDGLEEWLSWNQNSHANPT